MSVIDTIGAILAAGTLIVVGIGGGIDCLKRGYRAWRQWRKAKKHRRRTVTN